MSKKEIENEMFKILLAEKVHVLLQGETLGMLSSQYHVTLESIYELNPELRGKASSLQIGQEIKIPNSVMDEVLPLAGKTIDEMVAMATSRYNLDKSLFKELMRQESSTFDQNAVSDAGAIGLTQLMPGRVSDLGLTDPTDPAQSIMGGAALLRDYMGVARGWFPNAEKGDIEYLSLLMYNGGPTIVKSWLNDNSVKLPSETKNYAKDIFNRLGRPIPSFALRQ